MAVLQGAKSASVFDLLDGADTQGGYTYTIAPEPLTSVNTTTYLAKGSEVELVLRSVSPKEVPGAKYSACAYIRCGADGNMGFQRVGNEGSNCTP